MNPKNLLLGLALGAIGLASVGMPLAFAGPIEVPKAAPTDSMFSDGTIVITGFVFLRNQSGPIEKDFTLRSSLVVVTINGREMFEAISGWLSNADEVPLPAGRDPDLDQVSANFVIEFLDKDKVLKATFVSNGCVVQTEDGSIYEIPTAMKVFLSSLTARQRVPESC